MTNWITEARESHQGIRKTTEPDAMNALRELVEATDAHERRNRANTRAEYEAIEKRYLDAWTAARRLRAAGVALPLEGRDG